ncbi:sugar ABC transporter ATP-binding protein [Bacillus tianshenii]|uniref:sugar ABC transporter ATP-binding protein n=1 Tax=Sutcliffiella tianshenii TaxID=1463404 RepID=UPI001CD48B71|nr:sugar ABC transporter ATP-binding protein [Bacillus tianshenii]MCA1319446.1 sugar ABC transporter ATP-binding protein [Bacillus tianshenii]
MKVVKEKMTANSIPLLQVEEISKRFSGNPVLKDVSLSLDSGEIHAIVGGNGAGKSTLMKIITGLYKADSGVMKVKGKKVQFSSTHEAHQHGIYLVPQEPLIFPNMTVEENILIGIPGKKTTLQDNVKNQISRLGWKLSLHETGLSLSIAEKQLVEIIRGLVRKADILILDEPTSTLTFGEIDSLFNTINQLKREGMGLFYITHRFGEIFRMADKISVLRDGVISAQGHVKEFNYDKLLVSLLPENAEVASCTDQSLQNSHEKEKSTILQIANLTGRGFEEVSLSLSSGEILGIAGVVGAGRTELAESIAGISKPIDGTVHFSGEEISALNIRNRIDKGLIYVPEDRHKHGIFPLISIQSNISSTILHRLSKVFLPFASESSLASEYVSKFNIKATSPLQNLEDLSGGNQQKVVLSRCLAADPKVIILDEPTRGIDANAREDIYQIIHQLRQRGLAVLLISSDIEEIVSLSDRVIILYEGKHVKTLQKDEISPDTIAAYAFGVNNEVIVR